MNIRKATRGLGPAGAGMASPRSGHFPPMMHSEKDNDFAQIALDSIATLKNRSKSMLLAAEYGLTDIVGVLVKSGADVNVKKSDKSTPLHLASCAGHAPIVEILLRSGADADARQIHQCTPLHFAAINGHSDIVKLLISYGSDINAHQRHGFTALHFSAMMGHASIIELLLDCGVEIDAHESSQLTPLYFAEQSGHSECAQILIDCGASRINNIGNYNDISKVLTEYYTDLILISPAFGEFPKDEMALPHTNISDDNLLEFLRRRGISERTRNEVAAELTSAQPTDENRLYISSLNDHASLHPGEILKSYLEYKKISVSDAANKIGVTRQQIYRIVNADSDFSSEMALKLEIAFGIPAIDWLRMQAEFDLAQLRIKRGISAIGLQRSDPK